MQNVTEQSSIPNDLARGLLALLVLGGIVLCYFVVEPFFRRIGLVNYAGYPVCSDRAFLMPSFVWLESRQARDGQPRHYRAMAHCSEGDQPHDVAGYSREQLINDLLNRYARLRHKRRLA